MARILSTMAFWGLLTLLVAPNANAVKTLKDLCDELRPDKPALVHDIEALCDAHTNSEQENIATCFRQACELGRLDVINAILDDPQIWGQLDVNQVRIALREVQALMQDDRGNAHLMAFFFLLTAEQVRREAGEVVAGDASSNMDIVLHALRPTNPEPTDIVRMVSQALVPAAMVFLGVLLSSMVFGSPTN